MYTFTQTLGSSKKDQESCTNEEEMEKRLLIYSVNHRRMMSVEKQYIPDQKDPRTHSNASIEKLCQSLECPLFLLSVHFQTCA